MTLDGGSAMSQAGLTKMMCQIQECPAGERSSLLDHLKRLALAILDGGEGPIDIALLSKTLKQQNLQHTGNDIFLPVLAEKDTSQLLRALSIFGDTRASIDMTTGVVGKQQPPNDYLSQDMTKLSWMLEAVGAGCNEQEMYAINLQMKRLGENPSLKLKHVRFFGKFFGLHQDYYVFEAQPKAHPQQPAETPEERSAREAAGEYPPEPPGAGSNEFQYFVCHTLGQAPLIQLPDTRPEHIRAARALKRLLSGHLDAPVSTYPPFPWTEAEFLRAQIARIGAATVLAPTGWYTQEEDDAGATAVVAAEEQEALPMPEEDMDAWLGNWVHMREHMKRQGRCRTTVVRAPPEDAEEEEERELQEDEQEEPPEGGQVLAAVSDDAHVRAAPAWTPVLSSTSRHAKGQVLAVRSTLWPGALALSHRRDAANVYVGWGVKSTPFVPLPPLPIAAEYDDALVASVDMPVKPDPDAAPLPEEEGEAEE
eukprot:jgi/Ulvmu1/9662/UM054_0094.1